VIEGEREIIPDALEIFITPFYGEAAQGAYSRHPRFTVQKKSDEMRREFVASVPRAEDAITNVRSYPRPCDYGADIPRIREAISRSHLSESDRMTR
jgi:two-component system sensor histidine kinase VicK